MTQTEVLAILKQGKRVRRPGFDLRFLVARTENVPGTAHMAISVPKRLLKSAVARNRIKRMVREGFRAHMIAATPLNLLVSLSAKVDCKCASTRRLMRRELSSLFDDAVHRTRVRNAAPGVG